MKMMPSSSSQLAKYGQISHYKKFWILQTQLANQESPCSTASTTLCLGSNGGTMSTMKEGKKLTSAPPLLSNGDINNNSVSSRPETVAPTNNNRAIISPFCPSSTDPSRALIMSYNTNNSSGYPIINTINNSQALSLAVNCANSLNDPCFPTDLIQRWASPANHAHESAPSTRLQHPPRSLLDPPCSLTQLVQNPFPCATSECSTVEENGSETSTSRSSTLNQQINSSYSITDPSTNKSLLPPSYALRSCTLCGTTKTPLWRSGPEGPKSVCNACGIRMKKSRRLQEGGSGLPPSHKTMLSTCGLSLKRKFSHDVDDEEVHINKKAMHRRKGSTWPPPKLAKVVKDGDLPNPFTKPFKHFPRKKGGLQSDASAKLARLLNNRGRLTKVFAKDEEEAAVLLMALSCGLVLA